MGTYMQERACALKTVLLRLEKKIIFSSLLKGEPFNKENISNVNFQVYNRVHRILSNPS